MTPPPPLSKLLSDADSRRKSATAELVQGSRSDLGQFLTPAPVARLMAGMFAELPARIRLLDPGAGVGGLTAAFAAETCLRGGGQAIVATAYEVDEVLAPHLRETYANCRATCGKHDVGFTGRVRNEDFLEAAVNELRGDFSSPPVGLFNAAIMNPPYRKIGTASRERRLVRSVGLDATNLYAAFVALTVRLLEPDGQIVAIIPRSFCNGPYFRTFRDTLLSETAILRIHVFDSRKDAFRDDGVLQENVIIHVRKSKAKPHKVIISSSSGGPDGNVVERLLPYRDVVRAANDDQFIHLPTDADDDRTARWMATLPETLKSIGLTVSTGRVVDFRAKDYLRPVPSKTTVPLIYPCHFSNGTISWPKLDARKPNALEDCAKTHSLLVPRGYYVVTKRFSSKEERRRLVAAVYDPEVMTAPQVGFENHLNYFHRGGEGLSKEEAFGLCAFLNSEPIDRYFRQFNGHTQVNATDLRSLRYPSLDVLRELGKLRLVPGTPELEASIRERYPLD
ncbi:Eco57I restriction-modification methylase domain-containing protein [Corallococcus exiguus]|uniref:site-specific DNA-methyltransferase (adenine-specific) n=1 Tax=Corallococcus exiguus TaxID=83462 RepID=A0A7X5BS38_9BACT|nr:Eco57I restriction-modification methylase domain-containing protein [Corallococcus exiguus]NBC41489.1 SAM-dependent methyltransferase [Corallococcus exiguus]TNV57921.1 SAM-dependent DNA methyltransferase [Corallococcus exiguus]